MSLRDWLLVAAGVIVLVVVGFVAALPWVIQSLLRLMLWPRYRLKVRGLEHLPKTGPAVLALNHVTWMDGFIIAASCPRRGRALVNSGYIDLPILRSLAWRAGLIPVPFSGPRALRASIKATREALDRGEVVALFPEAQLTRTGFLGPFYRGIEVILQDRESIPVIPVYLDNLWGSVFSHSGGRFFRKWPRGFRRTVGIAFGPPVPEPITAFAVRQGVLAAGVRAFELREGTVSSLETLDPTLPHLEHPLLGPLTASAKDFHEGEIHQVGQKPGTVGHPLPGVALRIVSDTGTPLPPDAEGKVEALVAGKADWIDTGFRGSLDRDGFLRMAGGSGDKNVTEG